MLEKLTARAEEQGKLWISLEYDSNGFVEGTIEAWWRQLLRGVDEMLLA